MTADPVPVPAPDVERWAAALSDFEAGMVVLRGCLLGPRPDPNTMVSAIREPSVDLGSFPGELADHARALIDEARALEAELVRSIGRMRLELDSLMRSPATSRFPSLVDQAL
jgi:hypothetical protein